MAAPLPAPTPTRATTTAQNLLPLRRIRRPAPPSVDLLLALAASLILFLFPVAARGAPARVVVEIDAVAERAVDPRSARRLIALELADVAVPSQAPGRVPELFVRVLGREGGALRLELWERGEFNGARALNGAGENPALFARRVALAAAELGRRLARKREALRKREARLEQARVDHEQQLRARTQDGPFALRSELGAAVVPKNIWLVGPQATLELTLRGALRLDVSAEVWAGHLDTAGGAALYGVGLGPAYRVPLARWLDWDVAARATALALQAPAARSLDDVRWQEGSWTARATGASRLEVRLHRQLRLTIGIEAGALLRSVSYEGEGGQQRLRGPWFGSSLGLVVTPR